MKRSLLFTLLGLIIGFLNVNADYVNIQVDNAANVKVATQAGNGEVLSLQDGMNRVDLDPSQNPLCIEPANGAEIVSVTKNQTDLLYPGGDGKYRIGIEPMMLDIVTSGGSSSGGGDVEIMLFNMGAPGSAVATVEGTEVQWSTPVNLPAGTEILITPATGYGITNVSPLEQSKVEKNDDGSFTFTAERKNTVYVYTEVTGVKFTIDVDFAPNVNVTVGNDEEPLTLYTGQNNLVSDASKQPLYFAPAEGAEILSVTKNGEPVAVSPYGIRTGFAEGDAFVVTTKGKEVALSIAAAADNAPLDSYTFAVGERVLEVSGMKSEVKVNLGDVVTVTPVGANKLTLVTGGQVVPVDAPSMGFRVAGEDVEIVVYGEAAEGVNINVDSAERVKVVQSNGYGQPLELKDGLNVLQYADIKNALKISAAQDCAIVDVVFNGVPVEISADGSYLVSVTENCSLDITSKVRPESVPVSFVITPEELYSHLQVAVGGEKVELKSASDVIDVKTGTEVTVSSEMGYNILSISAGSNVVEGENNSYSFQAEEECMVAVVMEEIVAREGYALVNVKSDDPMAIYIYEYNGNDAVQKIEPNTIAEVKIGNTVHITTYSAPLFFSSVTANGEEVAPAENNGKLFIIPIEGTTAIVTNTYYKVQVSVSDTFKDANHSLIGSLYVMDGDKRAKSVYVNVGETVKFECEPSSGYVLDYVERYFPESDEKFGLEYTVTEADAVSELVAFRGVYTEVEKSYVVRGNSTLIPTDEGVIEAGFVAISDNGKEVNQIVATEGTEVTLLAYERDDYKFVRFMLWRDNSVTIDEPFIVNGAYADTTDCIDIAAEFEPRTDGVDSVFAADLEYDREAKTLSSSDEITVYDKEGRIVLEAASGVVSIASLENGIYFATSGRKAIKFVK